MATDYRSHFLFEKKVGFCYNIAKREARNMIFISREDFFEKVKSLPRISREQEVELAKKCLTGTL